uniref:Uncharacterized protein n=1 Tax=Leersia perrieri TaxID=77586 RepID=A0A0D9WE04_9ORYZ
MATDGGDGTEIVLVVDDADQDEATSSSFFDLDLTLSGSGDHPSATSDGEEEKVDVEVDSAGGEEAAINVETSSDEESCRGVVVAPAARLRGLLLRKLRKPKAAGKPCTVGDSAVSPSRFVATPRPDGDERRRRRAVPSPREAARKYMSKITANLARRGQPGVRDRSSPPRRSRDGSPAQHLQDGIESAIAHCKLSMGEATRRQ